MAEPSPATTRVVALRMTEAAAAFLDALDPARRAKAMRPFADTAARTDWAYFPRNHAGLPLLELDPRQQKLAHTLVASALSLAGYAKVTAIMALESVLNLIEERRLDALRDPGRYFVTVFGAPGSDRWGWRFEGHHVCLNFTLVDGELASPTPIFLGANPAEVRGGASAVTRPCGEEEDAARELLASLDEEQRRAAVLCPVAPPDFVLMNLPAVPESCLPGEANALPIIQPRFEAMPPEHREALRFDRPQPRGLPGSQMSGAQQKLLAELIDVYVGRLTEPLAAVERERIQRTGLQADHFAWAGEELARRPHYYRLQGPSFLVEYDNTQNGANHVHAVWRNPDGDFGGDLLREHVRGAH